jgi:hypothetical protein
VDLYSHSPPTKPADDTTELLPAFVTDSIAAATLTHCCTNELSKLIQALTLLICIREALNSNLGWDRDHSVCSFSRFYSHFLMALPANSGPWPLIQFRNHFSQRVGLLGRVVGP